MLSTYATRSLICFVSTFLLLIIYFSLSKPDYIMDTNNNNNNNNTISIRLLLIYSLLYSSAASLGFMFIDVVYHYYFKNI